MTNDILGRKLRFGLVAVSLAAFAGCDFVPDDGFAKVPNRERGEGPIAAAPAPPPYVAGVGGAGAAVPQLAAGAPAGVDQAMVEAGAQQFGSVCAACHGAGGAGSGAGPQLNDTEWLNITGSYDEIVSTIANGVLVPKQFPAPMPPRGGGPFNDEQVRQLAAYVFALSHQAGIMKRDENTYGSIGDKYDEYLEIAASKPKHVVPERVLPPQRPYVAPTHREPAPIAFAGIGFVLALLLLVLSAMSFMTAGKWSDLARDGASTGYTLVGFFLLIAAIGGALATWNHNFRVLAGNGAHTH